VDIEVQDLPAGITKVILRGRFDTTGAVAIELQLNTAASERPALVVDLSEVSFLSSYGIRVLLLGAKIAKSRRAKLVILCPDSHVGKVLRTAGMHELIPVFQRQDAALAALGT